MILINAASLTLPNRFDRLADGRENIVQPDLLTEFDREDRTGACTACVEQP